MKKHVCPCCGFSGLQDPSRSSSGGGSYEICPSCGFQFGVSDDDAGFTYARWRQDWIQRGSPWSSKGIPAPPGWNPQTQLASLAAAEEAGRGGKSTGAPRPR